MKSVYSFVLVAIILSACSEKSNPTDEEPDPFLGAPAVGELDPYVQNQLLGRGMNLGNTLEAPNEGDWGIVMEDWFFEKIAQAGFESVRIPVRWSTHAGMTAPYTIDSNFMDRVEWAVQHAMLNELLVVINIHHYEEIMNEPEQHKERFLDLWSQIAEHFAEYNGNLIFEILNEPHTNLDSPLWNEYLAEAITVIRQSNPGRTLMIGPHFWYNYTSLPSLEIPEDEINTIVSFHFYEPFQFTHQGAEWVNGADDWLGTTWDATIAEQQQVLFALEESANWGIDNDRPLNMGEFGAYSRADMDSRERWTAFVTSAAEDDGMSWHYWEFCSGFGAYDKTTGEWVEPLYRALIPE